jgi:hypothetical protein
LGQRLAELADVDHVHSSDDGTAAWIVPSVEGRRRDDLAEALLPILRLVHPRMSGADIFVRDNPQGPQHEVDRLETAIGSALLRDEVLLKDTGIVALSTEIQNDVRADFQALPDDQRRAMMSDGRRFFDWRMQVQKEQTDALLRRLEKEGWQFT